MKLTPDIAKDVVPMLFQSHVDMSQKILLRPSSMVRKPPPELISGPMEKVAMQAIKTAVMVREMLRPEPTPDTRALLMGFVLGGYYFEKDGHITDLASRMVGKSFLQDGYQDIPLEVINAINDALQEIVDKLTKDPQVQVATKEGASEAEMYMHIVIDAGWHTGKGLYRYEHDGDVLEGILAVSEEKDE